MEGYVEEMLVEAASYIPTDVECVRKEWEEGNILLFDTTQELNHYMKSREDKEKSIDVYQMADNRWTVDLALIGRRR